jgi:predicted transposase YbfD/YdcC
VSTSTSHGAGRVVQRLVTKGYGSSWIFEPYLTCTNALQRVQHPAFSLGKSQFGVARVRLAVSRPPGAVPGGQPRSAHPSRAAPRPPHAPLIQPPDTSSSNEPRRISATGWYTVKANQPTLLDRCARLAWHCVPVLDRTRDRGHGRVELRTLKAVTVNHFGFPHAAQVIQVTRKTQELRTRRWRTVTIYAITSLTFEQASPARLADYLRGHWAIENGLHYLRDTAFAEDTSRVRTGAGAHVMACCATWPSARCAAPGRSTSPPPSGTTPVTPPGPWPPSGSLTDDPKTTRMNRTS